MAFKDANQLYQQQDYQGAAAKYERSAACSGSNPECLSQSSFLRISSWATATTTSSAPRDAARPTTTRMLTKAIDNYKKSAEVEQDPKIKKLAMEYLVAAYGPDKLNDPSQAEPILRRMIELDPTEPSNYTYLSRIYEENGDYDAGRAAPGQGARDEAERPPVSTSRWPPSTTARASSTRRWRRSTPAPSASRTTRRRSTRSPPTTGRRRTGTSPRPEADKIKFVQAGNEAIDKAIKLKADYHEALTYKGLLLRVQAKLEKNPARQQQLLKDADQYRDRAVEVQKKQRAAGAGE